MGRPEVAGVLLALLGACGGDPLVLELQHPTTFALQASDGALTVTVAEAAPGSPVVARGSVGLKALGTRQRLFDALALVPGKSYRVRLEATATTCSGGRAVGQSVPFIRALGVQQVKVYFDCADTSSPAGTLVEQRMFHSATWVARPAPHGQVILAAGAQVPDLGRLDDLSKATTLTSLEGYEADRAESHLFAAKLGRGRVFHQAVAVGDEVVLLGGMDKNNAQAKGLTALDLVDRLRPNSAGDQLGVSGAARLVRARGLHAAVSLTDHRLLLIGGSTLTLASVPAGALQNAELYDPVSGEQQNPTGNPLGTVEPRISPAAAFFGQGRVLVTGGRFAEGATADAELFCLSGGCSCAGPCFQSAAGYSPGQGRFSATATWVPCLEAGVASPTRGAIYLIGGTHRDSLFKDTYFADIACVDTSNAAAAPRVVARLGKARAQHSATLVAGPGNTRRILVAGGMSAARTFESSAELVPATCQCPAADISANVRTLALRNVRLGHTATLLPDGTVLLAGGYTQTTLERFTPDQ